MITPTFLITKELDASNLRKTLFDKGIYAKEYDSDGLMLLYNKFDSPITTELERECRSLVIDIKTKQIKSYSCETPLLNNYGLEFLEKNVEQKKIITKCYEGTYLSLFYHNDKWYVSTRRCLNSCDSKYNETKSHYEMFIDVLKKSGYDSFDDFNLKLDITKSYYFVLIHHENKHIIDYTPIFGENYMKLCLIAVRDNNMCEIDVVPSFAVYDPMAFIFIAEKFDSIEQFHEENKLIKYDSQPINEGIMIQVWSNTMNKYNLVKLQYNNYEFSNALGHDTNIFKGFLYLYQNNKLLNYMSDADTKHNFKKIVNPLNTSESFDTLGIIDSTFKVLASELFELFKKVCVIQTGKQNNKELYLLLPKEYKDIIYGLRGLYYNKKALYYNVDDKNKYFKITDIYNYLKIVNINIVIKLIKTRRLMFNWVKLDSKNVELQNFGTISNLCTKPQLKFCGIITNKLFPDILPTDIP